MTHGRRELMGAVLCAWLTLAAVTTRADGKVCNDSPALRHEDFEISLLGISSAADGNVYRVVPLARDGYSGFGLESIALP